MKINKPSDRREQEADRVADAIMQTEVSKYTRAKREDDNQYQITDNALVINRKCSNCEMNRHKQEEEEDGNAKGTLRINAKGSGSDNRIPDGIAEEINSVRAGIGTTLDLGTRQFMESRFGYDFGKVRIHADANAARSARLVNANAYNVGNDIIFAEGQYRPNDVEGRRLLAHELTHVIQQDSSLPIVQRDLATPTPAIPEPAQPDLTDDQIRSAIAFNRSRFTADQTREIQDIVGTEPTGVWSEEDIRAVAMIQEEFGLTKDGRIGFETFRFISREQELEGLPTDDANCLTSFFALGLPVTFAPAGAGQHDLRGHFRVQAQFSERCNCADYQYRQFISGRFTLRRAGVVHDLSGIFNNLPAGRLTPDFREDGDTTDNPINYGHRDQPGDEDPEDHYIDNRGEGDQVRGCRYRNEDFPGAELNSQAGDEYDALMQFRGEIRRIGRIVRTLHWTAIRGVFRVP